MSCFKEYGHLKRFAGCLEAPWQDHVKQDWTLGLGSPPCSLRASLGAVCMQSAGPEV